MSAWDLYNAKMETIGAKKRDMIINHTQMSIARRLLDSAACKQVTIDDVPQTVAIINKSNLAVKTICAMPGERIRHGGLVDFANHKWLVVELDANNEVYERGLMKQCNFILKWINQHGELIEKWCIVEDGTKYLIGEHSEQMMTVGDARIAVTLPRDKDTVVLQRGRRFLIDDPDTGIPTAYQVTKLNKLFNVYDSEGVFRFILTEDELTANDNRELRIADFYNWTPQQDLDSNHAETGETLNDIVNKAYEEADDIDDDTKGVWL